ncbi:flagellar hook-length control protein FliK [bacterium]|nr:flagellar hook-length control protein FliK [bacterium]
MKLNSLFLLTKPAASVAPGGKVGKENVQSSFIKVLGGIFKKPLAGEALIKATNEKPQSQNTAVFGAKKAVVPATLEAGNTGGKGKISSIAEATEISVKNGATKKVNKNSVPTGNAVPTNKEIIGQKPHDTVAGNQSLNTTVAEDILPRSHSQDKTAVSSDNISTKKQNHTEQKIKQLPINTVYDAKGSSLINIVTKAAGKQSEINEKGSGVSSKADEDQTKQKAELHPPTAKQPKDELAVLKPSANSADEGADHKTVSNGNEETSKEKESAPQSLSRAVRDAAASLLQFIVPGSSEIINRMKEPQINPVRQAKQPESAELNAVRNEKGKPSPKATTFTESNASNQNTVARELGSLRVSDRKATLENIVGVKNQNTEIVSKTPQTTSSSESAIKTAVAGKASAAEMVRPAVLPAHKEAPLSASDETVISAPSVKKTARRLPSNEAATLTKDYTQSITADESRTNLKSRVDGDTESPLKRPNETRESVRQATNSGKSLKEFESDKMPGMLHKATETHKTSFENPSEGLSNTVARKEYPPEASASIAGRQKNSSHISDNASMRSQVVAAEEKNSVKHSQEPIQEPGQTQVRKASAIVASAGYKESEALPVTNEAKAVDSLPKKVRVSESVAEMARPLSESRQRAYPVNTPIVESGTSPKRSEAKLGRSIQINETQLYTQKAQTISEHPASSLSDNRASDQSHHSDMTENSPILPSEKTPTTYAKDIRKSTNTSSIENRKISAVDNTASMTSNLKLDKISEEVIESNIRAPSIIQYQNKATVSKTDARADTGGEKATSEQNSLSAVKQTQGAERRSGSEDHIITKPSSVAEKTSNISKKTESGRPVGQFDSASEAKGLADSSGEIRLAVTGSQNQDAPRIDVGAENPNTAERKSILSSIWTKYLAPAGEKAIRVLSLPGIIRSISKWSEDNVQTVTTPGRELKNNTTRFVEKSGQPTALKQNADRAEAVKEMPNLRKPAVSSDDTAQAVQKEIPAGRIEKGSKEISGKGESRVLRETIDRGWPIASSLNESKPLETSAPQASTMKQGVQAVKQVHGVSKLAQALETTNTNEYPVPANKDVLKTGVIKSSNSDEQISSPKTSSRIRSLWGIKFNHQNEVPRRNEIVESKVVVQQSDPTGKKAEPTNARIQQDVGAFSKRAADALSPEYESVKQTEMPRSADSPQDIKQPDRLRQSAVMPASSTKARIPDRSLAAEPAEATPVLSKNKEGSLDSLKGDSKEGDIFKHENKQAVRSETVSRDDTGKVRLTPEFRASASISSDSRKVSSEVVQVQSNAVKKAVRSETDLPPTIEAVKRQSALKPESPESKITPKVENSGEGIRNIVSQNEKALEMAAPSTNRESNAASKLSGNSAMNTTTASKMEQTNQEQHLAQDNSRQQTGNGLPSPGLEVQSTANAARTDFTAYIPRLTAEDIRELQALVQKALESSRNAVNDTKEVRFEWRQKDLGSIRFMISTNDSDVKVTIQADRKEVADAIEKSRSVVERMITDQGLRVERFEVQLRVSPDAQMNSNSFSDQQPQAKEQATASKHPASSNNQATATPTKEQTPGPRRNGLHGDREWIA